VIASSCSFEKVNQTIRRCPHVQSLIMFWTKSLLCGQR